MSGLNLDAATILKVTLLLGEMVVKHGPEVAQIWQRIFESGRLPLPEDYVETRRVINTPTESYFEKES